MARLLCINHMVSGSAKRSLRVRKVTSNQEVLSHQKEGLRDAAPWQKAS